MFINLFYTLRTYGVPVSTRELLDLYALLETGIVFADREQFYELIRLCMVKDEKYFDKFDRAMADYFEGIDTLDIDELMAKLGNIPKEWLELKLDPNNLTEAQRRLLKKYGSLEALMKALEERLKEQKERHQGGNKWVGTGGSSPFGAYGDHPEGIRVGGESRKRSAVKVWEQRKYRDLDTDNQLETRSMQMALRKLRKFARDGAADELDIGSTIKKTAQTGMLDVQLRPERRNRVKVLMLFDIGGSMDSYIEACERLFAAAKNEFKTLEFFYFHNCVYEYVWTENARRNASAVPTLDVLHKYGSDYRVIFVGDAAMSPYELLSVGGSVEYMSQDTGQAWLKRITNHFDKVAWLNPETPSYWQYTQTIGLIKDIMQGHMYPMTLHGIEDMTKYLAR
ncbi:VWA domain-containing protein [Moraxella osloensis]|uniref:von Willebrand factor A n=1 Tax=Enhydrobacter aerosaccus TaxID=225324 RepID=A0ABR5IPF0_9HYPH|nr:MULTISPECIES: VWA domain-containing protein [Pseudomonadota]KND22915.1 von Willebrand factor A [Enhydrobacter aerosaccus]MDI4479792.1 VWA domain-containing protein [Moraxella osloensis]MDK1668971.1 VWA domain-containing protein [Moraxella osloensis]QCR86381.1 VWA domain-containing protein [Moraxella osloensis]WNP26787.1 VWA domain-containing protein [Moraxella sp. DOX410]